MKQYIFGTLKNLKNPGVKLGAIVDNKSIINKLARINRGVKVVNSTVGRYSYVGGGSTIVGTDIGSFCSIACDVYIGLAGHTLNLISTSPIFTEIYNGTGHSWVKSNALAHKNKRTIIGNDIWIGHGAKILSGVTIGNGAVIAAGAIVTKDVQPYEIVGGVPAHHIRFRFDKSIINALQASQWWNIPDEKLKNKICFFQRNNISKELICNELSQ